MEPPPIEKILSSDRERDKLIAFATERYAQVEVLFLVAVWNLNHLVEDGSRLSVASAIYNEYIADGAPHCIKLSASAKKGLPKKLKAKKYDEKVFEQAFAETCKSLREGLLQDYYPHWLKQKKIDDVRRELISKIQFDIDDPPKLIEILKDETSLAQLRTFSESLYCSEIVDFWDRVKQFKNAKDDELECMARSINKEFIDPEGDWALNLDFDIRQEVMDKVTDGKIDRSLFEKIEVVVSHQIQQNLYHQFISHLKAIKREIGFEETKKESLAKASEIEIPEFVAPSFEEVLQDPILFQEMLSYSGRVYSQERVVFYMLVGDFKRETDEKVRMILAKQLFKDYIAERGIRQVSIEGRRYHKIVEKYNACCEKGNGEPWGIDITIFDSARSEVARSIEHEIFVRFIEEKKKDWESSMRKAAELKAKMEHSEKQDAPKNDDKNKLSKSKGSFFSRLSGTKK